MPSRLRRPRGLVSCLFLIVGLVGVIVPGVFTAFVTISPETRTALSWVAAASTTLLALVEIPVTRPLPLVAGDRSTVRAATGRIVIVSIWLVRAAIAGALALLVTGNFDSPGFHPVPAVVAVAGKTLAGARVYGRDLAGFVGERTRMRAIEVPRKVLGLAVTAAVTGFATELATVAKAVFEEGPGRVFNFLHNGMPGFFAVLVTILVCLVAAVVIVFVGGVLQRVLAAVIGEGNDLGAWLEDKSPVKYVRGYDFRQFYFKFVITLRGRWSARPSDMAKERRYRRMLKTKGPLYDETYALLTKHVLTAALALLPPGCRRFRVNLHVAGDHEEIVLETEETAAEPSRRLLSDFGRAAELRRLRAGVPFPEGVIFTTFCVATLSDQVTGTRQWSDVQRPDYGYSAAEPTWFTPPSRDQYVWELKRWPVFDDEIPYWLRDLLLPGPAYAQRRAQVG